VRPTVSSETTWILTGLAIAIATPVIIIAVGKPSDGRTILELLGVAALAVLLAIVAATVAVIALVQARPRAKAIAPFAAGMAGLALALAGLFYALLATAWS
jgi:hypothetical protein